MVVCLNKFQNTSNHICKIFFVVVQADATFHISLEFCHEFVFYIGKNCQRGFIVIVERGPVDGSLFTKSLYCNFADILTMEHINESLFDFVFCCFGSSVIAMIHVCSPFWFLINSYDLIYYII